MPLLSLAFSLLLSQTGALTTVGGRVVDSVSGLPVAGARVIFVRGGGYSTSDLATKPSTEQDPKAGRLAVHTDENGRFRFRVEAPVECHLFVDAPDYVSPWRGVGPENEFRATADAEKDDILVRLARERALSGRVIDYDTGEPVSELNVMPFQYRMSGPGRTLWPAGESASTDAKGEFRLKKLAPGEYYLQVGPSTGKVVSNPKPVEDFRLAVLKVYARSWYPGVARQEEALPVRLATGGDVEGIEIRLAKRRTASIRGRLLGPEQATKREALLMLGLSTRELSARSYTTAAVGEVKAGSEFQIDGLNAGTYWLSATSDGLFATRTVQIGEENQDGLDLYLSKGVTVQGHVKIEGREEKPGEPALTGESMRAELAPLVRPHSAGDVPVAVDSRHGAFTMVGVSPDQYQVRLAPLPAGYKVSEVRYNGDTVRNQIVAVQAGSREQRLEITLAPAAGAVLLTVMDGNDPAAKATVLAAPEPVDEETLLSFSFQQATTNESGNATVAGLLPGTYRLIAYREGVAWGDDPDLRSKLANGQQVVISARQMPRVRIEAIH